MFMFHNFFIIIIFIFFQDSSQYSGQSQLCCCLDGLHFSYFQISSLSVQTFSDCTEYTNYFWYLSFCFLSVLSYGQPEQQSSQFGWFFFFFFFFFWCVLLGLVVWLRLNDLFVSQNPENFMYLQLLLLSLLFTH